MSPFRERIPSTSTPHVPAVIEEKHQNVSPSEMPQSSELVQLKKIPCKSPEKMSTASIATSPMATVASQDFSCQALVPSDISNVGTQVSHESAAEQELRYKINIIREMELSHHDKMQNVREQLQQEKVKSSTHLARYTEAKAQIEFFISNSKQRLLATRI